MKSFLKILSYLSMLSAIETVKIISKVTYILFIKFFLLSDQHSLPECVFEASLTDSDEEIPSDGCGSPRMQRKKRPKIFRPKKVDRSITFRTLDELLYNDSLPEVGNVGWSICTYMYLYNSYNLHFFLQIVKGRNTSIFLFSITNDFFFLNYYL